MKISFKKLLLCFLLFGSFTIELSAQVNQDYFKANQLFRQQNYEEAFQIYQQLYQENSSNFTFLEKATECLINLKEYEKAISLLNQVETETIPQSEITTQLGEIYHVKGDTARAFSLWYQVLKENDQDRQVYIKVARTMKERRAYEYAIKVFSEIATFSNSRLIASELADTYLLAGQYEKAISHFLELVRENPNQISYVQNRLIRFQDDKIYEIAVSEIDHFLQNLPSGHPSYHTLQQLEVWLLMERNFFQKAVETAKTVEDQTSEVTYLLFNLGDKLQAEQQFELAEQAFSYYIKNHANGIKFRSMEQIAQLYKDWAYYLKHHSIGLSSRPQQLYKEAFDTLEQLRSEAPNYQQMDQVLVSLSELSLDILHRPDRTRQYLKEVKSMADSALVAQEQYIEGRLLLYEKNYNRARIAFTESTNQSDSGSLAEKTRYYLALTDFFAGDYEFAKIQLNALERQNTSYYANDAVQLRLWIQDGLQADSTGQILNPLARAVEFFSFGQHQNGIDELKPLFADNFSNPLADEALLELSIHKKPHNARYIYQILSEYLSQGGISSSPLKERLLWERARLADQFVTSDNNGIPVDSMATDKSSEEVLDIPQNTDEVSTLYEKILLNYPDGFYSTYARDRIRQLQNI